MKKIVYFNTEKEFLDFFEAKRKDSLGYGAEGECIEGIDGVAYTEKITGVRRDITKGTYNPNDIITSSDVKNKSFLFPDTLFAVGNKLVGYTTKVLPKNQLDSGYMILNDIDYINIDKLIKAFYIFLQDVIKLSSQNIKIDDLPNNLMYDGKKLVAIDTCVYTSERDPLALNLHSAYAAIKEPFKAYLSFVHGIEIADDEDPIDFLRYMEENYQTKHNVRTRKKHL